jgi:general secretion pathway protein A
MRHAFDEVAAPFEPAAEERSATSLPHGLHYVPHAGHEEALARLEYAVDEGWSAAWLTGAPGTGKSLLLRVLKERVRRAQRSVVLLDAADLTARELLEEVLGALGAGLPDDVPVLRLRRALDDHLTTGDGLPLVVLIDRLDAAAPDAASLLQRWIGSGESVGPRMTVVAAVRSGPRGLPAVVRRLQDRSDLRIELSPLDATETADQVRALRRRAEQELAPFDASALRAVHEATGGLPRDIDRLVCLAWLAGLEEGTSPIGADLVREAAAELWLPTEPRATADDFEPRVATRLRA